MARKKIEGTKVANLIQIKGSDIAVGDPRTLGMPKPAFYYLEPAPKPCRDTEKTAERNHIVAGPHQVDPNRTVSYSPVMPNVELAQAAGNPFPSRADDPSIVTNDYWRQFALVPYYTWQFLSKYPGSTAYDLALMVADRMNWYGSDGANLTRTPTENFKTCVRDVLRDLRLYGLAITETKDSAYLLKKTKWQSVMPESVMTLEQFSSSTSASPAEEVQAA